MSNYIAISGQKVDGGTGYFLVDLSSLPNRELPDREAGERWTLAEQRSIIEWFQFPQQAESAAAALNAPSMTAARARRVKSE